MLDEHASYIFPRMLQVARTERGLVQEKINLTGGEAVHPRIIGS
jgi:hypothetical protein